MKKKFGNKIIVKDIDELRWDFIEAEYNNIPPPPKKFDKHKYQKWIDNFIDRNSKTLKPIIFVGLNHMPWWNKNVYYDMRPNYKFYIKLDDDTIFKQKCGRFIGDLSTYKDNIINRFIDDENKELFIINDAFKHECGYDETKRMIASWDKAYRNQGYKFMSRDKIFDEIVKIINK